jgi:hypothetical protein
MNEESNDTSKIQEEPVKKNGVPTWMAKNL